MELTDYFNQQKKLEENSLEVLFQYFFKQLENLILYPCEFYSVKVDWSLPEGEYEGFYECYENDYLFDLGNEILFLHFGGSD